MSASAKCVSEAGRRIGPKLPGGNAPISVIVTCFAVSQKQTLSVRTRGAWLRHKPSIALDPPKQTPENRNGMTAGVMP
ncbi:hypothetical protein M2281_005109 [Mesorhizobium soli]|jgi:hypothetical protein|nr:hypothetical protein [Mesorhizobium soli]